MVLELGQVGLYTRTYTQEDYDRFAALSGDDNPIHVDPEFAATTRWGRTLAHGMMLYATMAGFVTTVFAPGVVQLEQQLRFPGPTFTGEAMRFRLEVTAVDGDVADIAAQVTRPNGDLACEGTMRVRLGGAP